MELSVNQAAILIDKAIFHKEAGDRRTWRCICSFKGRKPEEATAHLFGNRHAELTNRLHVMMVQYMRKSGVEHSQDYKNIRQVLAQDVQVREKLESCLQRAYDDRYPSLCKQIAAAGAIVERPSN